MRDRECWREIIEKEKIETKWEYREKGIKMTELTNKKFIVWRDKLLLIKKIYKYL